MSGVWPSKNVAQGGIFHPTRVQYSAETKQLLNTLMEESKMSMMQRQKMDYFLRNSEPLPSLAPKISFSRNGKKISRIPKITIRPGSSKKRTFETIVNSGAYERDRSVPFVPRVDRDKEKLKLQNRMAFGRDIDPEKSLMRKPMPKLDTERDYTMNRFDQLAAEIKEREDWLQEMYDIGEGDKYKLIIEQQIQARVREMNRLQ